MALPWHEFLTKPLLNLFDPLTNRIGRWLGHKKPKLYVHFNVAQSYWCIAHQGVGESAIELMQVVSWADFTHDDPTETLVITAIYPVGSAPQIDTGRKFAIPPRTLVKHQITAFVLPIKGVKGKPWKGRLVVVDQFFREYKTLKFTFKWWG